MPTPAPRRRLLLSVLLASVALTGGVGTTLIRDPTPPVVDTDTATVPTRTLPTPLRGVWMATVEGLDLPPVDEGPMNLERELRARVGWAHNAGMNAIFVQVRAEGDALYPSATEPWNHNLTGELGADPGVDPLMVILDEAHDHNIQVHAWINPFRAAADRTRPLAETHLARQHPELAIAHGPHLWFDPASPRVQAHVLGVVTDLLERYDLDGIHVDDYFYPYPRAGEDFADGGRSPAERQAKIDAFITDLSSAVRSHGRPLTISPFGLHPTQPDFRGFDPVAGLHADPLTWSRAGQLDALVPQVYWPTDDPRRPHTPLASWWCETGRADGTPIAIGHAIHPVVEGRWPAEELVRQAEARPAGCPGAIWFRLAYLEDPALRALFRERIHADR